MAFKLNEYSVNNVFKHIPSHRTIVWLKIIESKTGVCTGCYFRHDSCVEAHMCWSKIRKDKLNIIYQEALNERD